MFTGVLRTYLETAKMHGHWTATCDLSYGCMASAVNHLPTGHANAPYDTTVCSDD